MFQRHYIIVSIAFDLQNHHLCCLFSAWKYHLSPQHWFGCFENISSNELMSFKTLELRFVAANPPRKRRQSSCEFSALYDAINRNERYPTVRTSAVHGISAAWLQCRPIIAKNLNMPGTPSTRPSWQHIRPTADRCHWIACVGENAVQPACTSRFAF